MPLQKLTATPIVRAADPWTAPHGQEKHPRQLLSEDIQARLVRIATVVRFKKGDRIYSAGDSADAAFNIVNGVTAACRGAGAAEHIVSFLYPGDIFGLSDGGAYTNSIKAVTTVTAYKMPIAAIRRLMDSNPDLDVGIIIKLCEELRETQRHSVLLTQKKAATRLAMFLCLQERLQIARAEPVSEIYLPMDRSSISAYLGLTASALSRAFHSLISRKIIRTRDRRHVKILNRGAFDEICDSELEEDV